MTERSQKPNAPASKTDGPLPIWAEKIVDLYNSHACNQFILAGNIHDLFLSGKDLLTLPELIQQLIVPRFNVVLSYDIGNGLRVDRGADIFGKWNEKPETTSKNPRTAIELITVYLRYAANIAQLGQTKIRVAVILKDAELTVGGISHDTNALAFLVREWSREPLLTRHDIVSFILTTSLGELPPLLTQNAQAAQVVVPLPTAPEIQSLLTATQQSYPIALKELSDQFPSVAQKLAGSTLQNLRNLLLLKEHRQEPLRPADLAATKAALIAKECPGLMEILSPSLTLRDVHGQDALKANLRQNLALWQQNRLDLIPMGYLICGPVGTGKTFLVKALAGEANVPVLILKNFREKWYGSTEANLEKIFRTIRAIGQCYVFIDEADQTIGRRDTSGSEPGVSGRIYSMLAQEMSDPANRGKIVWILATSRPDLLEIDLKRPGRIDFKIPLFPTTTPREGFDLIQSIARKKNIDIPDTSFTELKELIPDLLTPGEVEAFLTDLQRVHALTQTSFIQLLRERFTSWIPAIPHQILNQQIQLAIAESSNPTFIPDRFRA